jgi:TPR repeat protein
MLISIGKCYEFGNGVDAVDLQQALLHYKSAADQGYRKAQFRVGQIYEVGNESEKGLAFSYFEKAAHNNNNNGEAYFKLGLCYDNGTIVKMDLNKAIELYEKAGDYNYPQGYYNIGIIYLYGEEGIEKDVDKAINYFAKSESKGLCIKKFTGI